LVRFTAFDAYLSTRPHERGRRRGARSLQQIAGLADPEDTKERIVKKDIHPEYVETEVTCTCGNTFTTRSTAKNGVIHAEVCSNCHPFYTGKQKILDTGGRVARFEARYGKKAAK
jgi:large subunit ribosomal protein L31